MHKVTAPLSARATALALASIVSVGFSGAIYGPSLSSIAESHAVENHIAGFVIPAHGAGAFTGVALSLHSRLDALMRFRSSTGLLLIAIGALLIGGRLALPFAFLGAFLIGLGYGLLTVGLNGLFARSFGKNSGAMVNLLNTMFGIGSVSAPFVFFQTDGSIALTFLLLAVYATLLILPALAIDDRGKTIASEKKSTVSTRITTKQFAALATMFLAIGTEVCVIGWGPTILLSSGIDPLTAAVASSWFFVVYLTARTAAIFLSLYIRPMLLLFFSLVSLFVLSLCAWSFGSPYMWFIAMGVAGILFPNGFSWLVTTIPSVARIEARIVLAALLGATLMPLGLGQLASVVGTQDMFGPLALLWATTISVALWTGFSR